MKGGNMKRLSQILLRSVLILAVVATALAVKVGEAAPDFTATDSNGKTQHLADLKGKYVVLEWHNQGCPYTKKHYDSGNMQRLQKEWTEKGVVWFTVVSSAPGTQGYVTADEENDYVKRINAAPTAVLLDPDGTVGHLYAAKTTPHMYVIDPQGTLVYQGAIDDHPTSDPADISGSKNYVSAALRSAIGGQPIAEATTRPYGCSVKYKH